MDLRSLGKSKVTRVLWAIDPFETDIDIDAHTAEEFGQAMADNQVVIEPVYVFTPFGEVEALATDQIAKRISEEFRARKITTAEPYVLVRPTDSEKSLPQSLLAYAAIRAADLIVVSSHGRSGISRMLFGSFAESLLDVSPLPLLFLNGKPRPSSASLKHVLWATDFSKTCEYAFGAFLNQAQGICARISLFHDVSLTPGMRAYFAQTDIGVPYLEDSVERQRVWAEQQAQVWQTRARAQGFAADFTVESGHASVAGGTLAVARESGSGMIAMASQVGSVGSMIWGSYAREVFRASEFPVWVYGRSLCASVKEEVRPGAMPDWTALQTNAFGELGRTI